MLDTEYKLDDSPLLGDLEKLDREIDDYLSKVE
jgi:hypothetical protein